MWASIAVSTLLASLLLAVAALARRIRFGPVEDRWRLPPIRLRPNDASRFGPVSSTRTPLVVDFDEGGGDALAGAGRMAARTWFGDLLKGKAPFEAHVLVATARPRGLGRRGRYADPRSPWHAVLFGVVEITIGAAEPHFGRDRDGTLWPEPIARLLGACFSNVAGYLYGVPLGALAPYRPGPADAIGLHVGEREAFRGHVADVVHIAKLPVPSPARARRDTRPVGSPDPIVSRAVRFLLGTAPPSETLEQSFSAVPLTLRVRVLSRMRRDPDLGEQKVTTLLVTTAPAEAPPDEGEALRAAQDRALWDWLERVEAERAEDR